jgi:hypothetical protein
MKFATLLFSLAVITILAPAARSANLINGFVVSAPDGSVVRGTGYSVFHVDTGKYEVDTAPNIHSCAYSITAGSGDATVPPVSIATVVGRRENQNAIMVATFDSSGHYADEGFHLVVRCLDAQTDGAAVVDPDGTLVRGIFASTATRLDTGSYQVTFSNGGFSSSCAYTASIGLSATSGVSDAGFVTVAAVSAGTIAVRTYDTHGNAADLGFHVFGACNL